MKKLALVLVVASCSDSNGVALKDLLKQLDTAFCKRDTPCQYYPDMATCLATFSADDTVYETMIAAVTAKTAKYDEGLGAACVSEIEAQGCTFTGYQGPTDDPCATMFTGLVAVGGACFESLECANQGVCNQTDTTCDPNTACCPGTCAVAPAKAAIGAACSTTADCVAGAYCTLNPSTFAGMTCAALVAQSGGACQGFDGCTNPMVCGYDFNNSVFTTCATPAARMAACDPNSLQACVDYRDYCDLSSMKCTQEVAIGQACEGTNGALCENDATCTSSLCVARVATGGACTVDQFGLSNCLGSLACTSGTCQQAAATACN